MSRISPVQLGASVRKFNLNRPFICPILRQLHHNVSYLNVDTALFALIKRKQQ